MVGETFKVDEKKEIKDISPKKKFLYILDQDETEIKKLSREDLEEAVKVMRKCSFDVTDKEVVMIIDYNMSFGCYVNRMLIGVGLSWPAHYDENEKGIRNGEPNAIYCEDPAVLLSYEGRGIRRILLKTREENAKSSGYKYVLTYLSEDLPKGGLEDYIRESGGQLEKLYLSENYQFLKTDRGILRLRICDYITIPSSNASLTI